MPTVEEVVARVGDLANGEMREVKVGDKKVLLSKVKDQFYATSPLCTHYKAPLAKGVLTEDGRVMCPWHGACFNVHSGDIEDPPALDALAKYVVRIDGDKVVVVADTEALESGRRLPSTRTVDPTKDKRTFVVIGGGAGGMTAVETLREEGFEGRIVLVSKETHLPIDRVKLSKGLKVEADKILLRGPAFFKTAAIETKLGTTVTKVDPAGKRVTLSDGSDLAYDALLIATGGTPRNFWPVATKMSNVVFIRGMEDAQKLDAAIAKHPNPRIVTVGSSFIALEAASVLVKGAQSLTVIGMEKVPFERVLGEKLGAALQKLHEEKGIKFRMQAVVSEFVSADGGATCSGLKFRDGEIIEAEIVIVGAGVSPTTEFLKGSLELGPDGSIHTDDSFAVAGQKDIYAVGDIARFPYFLNAGSADHKTVRIEHWNVAMQQGRVAARAMLGKKSVFRTVPYFWTTQFGKSLRYTGHALSYDDVIIQGDLNAFTFVAFFVAGEDVVAVASMGRDPEVSQAAELLRMGLMPKASELRAGKSLLDVATCGKGSISINASAAKASAAPAASASAAAAPAAAAAAKTASPAAAPSTAASSSSSSSSSAAGKVKVQAEKRAPKIEDSGSSGSGYMTIIVAVGIVILAIGAFYFMRG